MKKFYCTVDSCGMCPALEDEDVSGRGFCNLKDEEVSCDSLPVDCPLEDE